MKNTCYSITIGEHNQKKILENKKNVHKQPTVLKNLQYS